MISTIKPPINTPSQQTTLPSVQLLNRLLFEHQQKTKNSSVDSSINPSTSSPNSIDLSAILRALLAKQGQRSAPAETHVNDTIDNPPPPSSAAAATPLPSPSPPPPSITSQLLSDSSSTTAALG